MTRLASGGPAALLLAAASACAESGAGARTAVVRDSAGVAIVESTGPAWRPDEALGLAPEPAVVIGDEERGPEYQFGRVSAAVRLSDGRLAVLDGMSNELRFYDARGTFLSRTGGKGGGPAEYQYVSWMRRLPGDSLMLHDMQAQRITVLRPDGQVARSVNLAAAQSLAPPPAEAGRREGRIVLGGLGRYRVLAPFADGTLLARAGDQPRLDAAGAERDTVTYVRLNPDGGVRDTLVRLVGDQLQAQSSGSGSNMFVTIGPPPFGKTSVVAVDGDGFWFGAQERYELARYDTAGRLVRLVRRPVEPLPVTPEDAEAQKRLELESRGADEPPELRARMRQATEQRWEKVTLPPAFPAYGTIMTDDNRHLWVRETSRPTDRVPRWTVFHPDGTMLGTVALPEGFRPLEFGDEYVLGVRRDDDDVEQVALYDLRPARS